MSDAASGISSFIVIIVCILALATLILALLVLGKKGVGKEKWPLYSTKPLSNPEQVLYFRLVHSLPDYVVLAQVQLSRFLKVKKGHKSQIWLNRINRLSADFVICSKDFSVLAVIELDDATHKTADRKQTDLKKDQALTSAEVSVIRWKVSAIPDDVNIKSTILDIVNKKQSPQKRA